MASEPGTPFVLFLILYAAVFVIGILILAGVLRGGGDIALMNLVFCALIGADGFRRFKKGTRRFLPHLLVFIAALALCLVNLLSVLN